MNIPIGLPNSEQNPQKPVQDVTPVDPVSASLELPRCRPTTIPAPLKRLHRWMPYRLTLQQDGKFKKIPVDRNGNPASITDLRNHLPFEEAIRLLQMAVCDMIGFVLGPELKITVVDLDDCRNPKTGELTPESQDIIQRLNSYTEVSLSGTGIHIFCHAVKPGARSKNAAKGVEIYDQARAIIVTGFLQAMASSMIEKRQSEVDALYGELFPDEVQRPKPSDPQRNNAERSVGLPADEELLAKAKAAKNGNKFAKLWGGQFREAGFESQSEADAALLGMLRFWCSGDKDRAIRLFGCSGLNREKWEREDYRERTWAAIDSGDVYSTQRKIESKVTTAPATDTEDRTVFAFGGDIPVPECARNLAEKLGECGDLYLLHENVIEYDGTTVRPVSPAKLAALAQPECVALQQVFYVKGKMIVAPYVMSKPEAEIVLASPEFRKHLPKIDRILPLPGYVDHQGTELCWVTGYCAPYRVFARENGKSQPMDMSLEHAVRLIRDLTGDFRLLHEAERSRIVAMILSPAFMLAGVQQGGRTPLFLLEAKDSQTGKGYLARVNFALYGLIVGAVSQRRRGVGSMEESLHSKILNGDTVVFFDNLKGSLNSPEIESCATEDFVSCRVPHRGAVTADVRNVMMVLTSNAMEVTPDLENRMIRIRIRKQSDAYRYRQYPEGDLLAHVRKNQWMYYSAVCRVLLEWDQRGRPRTQETRHARREWAQIMDWVVQELFHLPPLLDGVEETQARAKNHRLEWLRSICIAVDQSGQVGQPLTTTELLAIMDDHDVPVTRTGDGVHLDEDRRVQTLGTRLAPLFRNTDGEQVCIEEYTVQRAKIEDQPFNMSYKPRNYYTFTKREDSQAA